MSHPLLVGADVHRKTNTLCLMDREGQEVGPRLTVENNRPGTQVFIMPCYWPVIVTRPRQAYQDAGLPDASPKTGHSVCDCLFPGPRR